MSHTELTYGEVLLGWKKKVCRNHANFIWVLPKNRGGLPLKSSILIGFSIIFTIHFGVPLFLETSIFFKTTTTYQSYHQHTNTATTPSNQFLPVFGPKRSHVLDILWQDVVIFWRLRFSFEKKQPTGWILCQISLWCLSMLQTCDVFLRWCQACVDVLTGRSWSKNTKRRFFMEGRDGRITGSFIVGMT